MTRILVTGSTDGIGYATAASLLDAGHEVIVHARSEARLSAVADLHARGAETVVGDFAHLEGINDVVDQVKQLAPIDV